MTPLTMNTVCLADRQKEFSKSYPADRAGTDNFIANESDNFIGNESAVSSLNSKLSKSASAPPCTSGRHNNCNKKLNISCKFYKTLDEPVDIMSPIEEKAVCIFV